jgi:hypothetical protein
MTTPENIYLRNLNTIVESLKQKWNSAEKEAQKANKKLVDCRFCLEQLLGQKNVDSDIVRTVQDDFDEAEYYLTLTTSKRDDIQQKYDSKYAELCSFNMNFFEQAEQEEQKHNDPRSAPAPLLRYEPFVSAPRPSAPVRQHASAPRHVHKQSAGRNAMYAKLTNQKKVFKK